MNQYQKYKEAAIYSMSGPELLFMLFDEAISRLKKAEYALEDKEYKLFEDCLDRVARILRYLIEILDREQPLSWDLRRIYRYLLMDISKVKAGRDREKEEIARIRHILSELYDGFEKASRSLAGTPASSYGGYR
ncbi:MAG: flagellar protein FliS [Lachnospiraceae bacterium]|nr:flagellar protein FliS [Lachnospiraceae bacterium]